MGPGVLLERISRYLDPLAPDVRIRLMRALLELYPIPPLTSAERVKRHRYMRSNENVSSPDPPDETKTLQPMKRKRYTPPQTPPLISDPVVSGSSESTATKESTNYPENQGIEAYLREIHAPATFYDGMYWTRIHNWLGSENSGVFYLPELAKYLAFVESQNGQTRPKNLRRGFRNWLAKSEFWSQQRAATAAHKRRRD